VTEAGGPPGQAGLDVSVLDQRAVGQLIVRVIVVRLITLAKTIALARLLTRFDHRRLRRWSTTSLGITFGAEAALFRV
jgi:hypothetical protein